MIKAEIDCKLESLCLAGMIDKEMKEFCMPPKNHRTSRLYFLKTHKNPMGTDQGCNSITENISQFVDIWLQPLMRDLLSFIKDTTEFIRLIENTPLPDKCILASTDVSSLSSETEYYSNTACCILYFVIPRRSSTLHSGPNTSVLDNVIA